MDLTTLALWALVIALGLQTGAGIFETRVLVPLWAASPPQSVVAFFSQPIRPDSGRRLWIFLTPITSIICIINLILAVRHHHPWWIAAAGGALLVMIVTFAYFVPVLVSLPKASAMPAEEVRRKVRLWVGLNYVRAIVLIASWLCALKAFAG